LKALAKRPAERPQTARHLGASLRKLLPDLLDTRVGRGKEDAAGPSSSKRAQAFERPQSSPSNEVQVARSLESARTMVADGRLSAPASVVLHEREPDSDSSDDLRTLVRASVADLPALSNGFAPPPFTPVFGPPPPAPRPFTRTEKSFTDDRVPHARGAPPAPVGIVAAPLLPPGPGAAMPPFPSFTPFPQPGPPPRVAGSDAWTRGSRGLLLGFAFGVTIVAMMIAAFVLLR
jgi:hypothetical protein